MMRRALSAGSMVTSPSALRMLWELLAVMVTFPACPVGAGLMVRPVRVAQSSAATITRFLKS
jgi:hypothetical protein